MAIARDLRKDIEAQKFDSIEDEWLAHAAEAPGDVDWFVGVARALTGVAEDDRARFLLEMLDDQLVSSERWRVRLELLRAGGTLYLDTDAIHPAIVEALRGLHGDTPSFDDLVQAVRLDKAPHDIPKQWEKVDRFRELVEFDVGAIVWMDGKGAGRVTDVNLALDSLKVDFEKHPGLTVGFRAAAKMLVALGPEHVLRRRMEDPDALVALGEEDPSELLRVVLTSWDRPLAAGDVREALGGIVPDSKWTSWWATARKSPQVVAGAKGRQTYTWADSADAAADAVWGKFEKAGPRHRLTLLIKEGERDPDLQARMVEVLTAQGEDAVAVDPGLAFETWSALEAVEAEPTTFGPATLLGPDAKPTDTIPAIEDRSRRIQAVELVRRLRPDWAEVYALLLTKEEDARVLEVLADGLIDEDEAALFRFVDQITGQPHKGPAAFTWIAERAGEDPTFRERSAFRLLQQIPAALLDKRFTPYRQRLVPMAESGGTLPRLLPHLSETQAAQAEDILHRASGLESYQRDALVNALHLKFPALHKQHDEVIYSTPEAIAERREQLRQLVQEELPANRQAIEEARALGDLRENFEYKSARQRHEYLSSRQAKLEHELSVARPLDPKTIDTKEVRIGTRVELANGDEERTFTILGPWDSDPERGVLAYESDLAQKLLGKAVGETVEVGDDELEVRAISVWK